MKITATTYTTFLCAVGKFMIVSMFAVFATLMVINFDPSNKIIIFFNSSIVTIFMYAIYCYLSWYSKDEVLKQINNEFAYLTSQCCELRSDIAQIQLDKISSDFINTELYGSKPDVSKS